jgi:hypothetical protein
VCVSDFIFHRIILYFTSLQANGTAAAYLFQPDKENTEMDFGDKTIQCGRKVDTFKFWLMWKALGDSGLERRVDKLCSLAEYMTEQINTIKDEVYNVDQLLSSSPSHFSPFPILSCAYLCFVCYFVCSPAERKALLLDGISALHDKCCVLLHTAQLEKQVRK